MNVRTILGILAVVALALPALVSAHPSLYTIEQAIPVAPEEQVIEITGADDGTFKPSADAKAIPWNAPAYMVQDALGADPAIGRNATTGLANVLVTQLGESEWRLRFQGSLAAVNVNQVVPVDVDLDGPDPQIDVQTTTQGGQPAITYQTDPTGLTMPRSNQMVITNDGWVAMYTETNGVADGGWLNLKYMPGGYRGGGAMTSQQWLQFGPAQTSFQTHATCQNVPELYEVDVILKSQTFYGNNAIGDPFWNYVPWQKTSVDLNDNPAKWIAAVEEAIDVDLNDFTTVAEFRTACEDQGGVYVPADTRGNVSLAQHLAPLNALIATLQAEKAALEAEVADLEAEVADLEAELDAIKNRPLSLSLAGSRQTGDFAVMANGAFGQQVTVKLILTKKAAKSLGVKRQVAMKTQGLGGNGATLITLKPNKKLKQALAARGGAVPVTVEAVSNGQKVTKKGSLAR